MISLLEARKIIDNATSTLKGEVCDLHQVLGRFTSESILAREEAPGFDRSMMDGYAVAHDDQSTEFRIVGEIQPGDQPTTRIGQGECMRIFTGAAIPPGASQVIMQEEAERSGNSIKLYTRNRRSNIRQRGEDAQRGDTLLKRGSHLSPGELALLAQSGIISDIPVIRQPRVRHITTGRELVPPEVSPTEGQTRDSNSSLIAALLRRDGVLFSQKSCGDDSAELESQVLFALQQGCDLLLISGGASVGDYDFGARVLRNQEFQVLFSSVNLKPGKPLTFATRHDCIAFVIPGNPVSHFVTYQLAIRAALQKLVGLTPSWSVVEAALGADLDAASDDRETFLPARLQLGNPLRIYPVQHKSSGDSRALVDVNSLIRLQGFTEKLRIGNKVSCVYLSPLLGG